MYKKILVGLITGFISLMKKNQEQQQYFPCL